MPLASLSSLPTGTPPPPTFPHRANRILWADGPAARPCRGPLDACSRIQAIALRALLKLLWAASLARLLAPLSMSRFRVRDGFLGGARLGFAALSMGDHRAPGPAVVYLAI